MEMRMSDRLSSGVANVYPYVVAVGSVRHLDVSPHICDQAPHRCLFFLRQSEEIGFMPARDYQAVARAQ
jgi:hypothetical protein